MSTTIDGMTAADWQRKVDERINEQGDAETEETELIRVGGHCERAYVLRSCPQEEGARSVLCAWRGMWVSWVQVDTGTLYWGRYHGEAERSYAERCSRSGESYDAGQQPWWARASKA